MKNLYGHVIRVNTNTERKIALEFYRQASKRPFYPGLGAIGFYGCYVGLSDSRYVVSNNFKYGYEKVVLFSDIATLADTPSRVKALANARNMYPTVIKPNFSQVTSVPTTETKKTPSKMLPVVTFWYPSSVPRKDIERKVRVVKADTIHIIGFDINNNEQFKKFKREKVVGLVFLETFNA